MQEKYVCLHRSYSAPVRVFVKSIADVATARDVMIGVKLRADVSIGVRDGRVSRDVLSDVRAVAARADVVVVRAVVVVVRAGNTVMRALDRFCVVAVRDCVAAFRSDFARETAVPSRTAASARPENVNSPITKTRILFISDEIIAKL